jgi:hypothetical protein
MVFMQLEALRTEPQMQVAELSLSRDFCSSGRNRCMIQIPNLSIWTQPITCNPLHGCPGVIQGLLINGAIDALVAAMKLVWHAVAIGVKVHVKVPCEALSFQLTWP